MPSAIQRKVFCRLKSLCSKQNQSLVCVCVCVGTGGALKWSDLLIYWNSVMEEESFISVSFFPLLGFRPWWAGSIVRLHRMEGLQESDEYLGSFTYKRYFWPWHFAMVKEKASLAAVWYSDRYPITVTGIMSYQNAKKFLLISVIFLDHSKPVLGSGLPVIFLWNP